MHLRLSTGRAFAALDDVQEAVRISACYPDSPEHALAVAELAHAELWHDEPSGPSRAQEAVRLARASGSNKALAYALTADVMRRVIAWDGEGLPEAEEAQAAAAHARDFWAFSHAALWAGNCIDGAASWEVIECWRRAREEMTSLGAPHTYVAWMSASEASGLLLLGEWRACEERLRVVLGSTPGPMGDVQARLTAALLSCWQGRPTEAYAHLARADELFAEQSGFLAFPFDAIRAELAVAAGDPEQAFSAALAGVSGPPPTFAERLIPLAARAAADQAQAIRDRGEDPARAVERLHDLQSSYPTVVEDAGPGPMYQAQLRAMQAWYDAEIMRGPAGSKRRSGVDPGRAGMRRGRPRLGRGLRSVACCGGNAVRQVGTCHSSDGAASGARAGRRPGGGTTAGAGGGAGRHRARPADNPPALTR
jgi:hypothetical protein